MADIFGPLAQNPVYVTAFSTALRTIWQVGTREALVRYLEDRL